MGKGYSYRMISYVYVLVHVLIDVYTEHNILINWRFVFVFRCHLEFRFEMIYLFIIYYIYLFLIIVKM